jgi:hypothetical protein
MTRQIHDQFSKQYLTELLEPLGEVKVNQEIFAEPRHIDLYFIPNVASPSAFEPLGLLGKMVSTYCLLEPFRNQPSNTEIRNCLIKLFSLQSYLQPETESPQRKSLTEAELPYLWILTTTASTALLDYFGTKQELPTWPTGVYFFAAGLKTAIIAINKLPITPDTLWLRILGKGRTQQQAIEELLACPDKHPFYRRALELLSKWRIMLGGKDQLTEDEQEVFMNLSTAYQKWREETLLQGVHEGLHQGLQEGLQEGLHKGLQQGHLEERHTFIENLLALRFGVIDEPLMAPLLMLPPQESLRLLLQLSREELLVKFNHH